MNDILITGVPRSGTTLTCFLLNKLPDVVALHEPIADWGDEADAEAVCDRLQRFFPETRAAMLLTGRAPSKHIDGRIPDNPRGSYTRFSGFKRVLSLGRPALRKSLDARGIVEIDKPLNDALTLCVKHNGRIAALLEPLKVQGYPCFAIIRHPLAILASWNSIDFKPYHGRLRGAELLDRELSRQLDEITDRHARQIHLLNWFFEAFHAHLSPDQIIKYEDVVSSGGKALHPIVPSAKTLDETLTNRNHNALYDHDLMRTLAERLERSEGAFWHYYERDSCHTVMEAGR